MNKIFKLICCGSVDDGKSTLIGKLLFDTNNVKKDQLADALKASQRNGSENLEYSMLLDGLLSEREQQITIDVAHRFFDFDNIRFHILDCPGHKQYTKNMAIAAACADAAILVIDATKGISSQTIRHLEICKLFNVKNICCCLTKIDLFGSESEKEVQIHKISKELEKFSKDFVFFDIIPVSASIGINIDKVLQTIIKYSREITTSTEYKIMHVHAVRLYKGERYYYTSPVNDITPDVGERYFIYSDYTKSDICVTISNIIGYGCFQIQEDVDIQRGDAFSNKPILSLDKLHHQTIWFDTPTNEMLIKHGTRIAKIVSINDNILETDRPLFINNITDFKQNSLAIIIDNISKKTLACVVFKNNVFNETTSDCATMKNSIIFNQEIVSSIGLSNIKKVAQYLMKQGYQVKIDSNNDI